jgi:hypothetical protein
VVTKRQHLGLFKIEELRIQIASRVALCRPFYRSAQAIDRDGLPNARLQVH